MSADVHELLGLARDLEAAPARIGRDLTSVVNRGALNVKRGWQANARTSSGRHARLYPSSISYDPHPVPAGASAEIGPDKSRPQGALGNLLEFGSVNNAPHMDGARALADEEPRFLAAVAVVADPLGPR
ncbi:hypothetical protein [Streptomyces sp. bgisy154]|uniref:hypothetical protein n=1 Tax=Streptomyces sp. bgisy154 TaxID=3413794 RepID=UPI003D71E4E7